MAVSILDELENPTSSEALLGALKTVKNDIVGHHHRKELWVHRGIIPCLKRLLNTNTLKQKQGQRDGIQRSSGQAILKDPQEEVRLQAIAIVGSLAHGGPSFIRPMRLGHIWRPLLQAISPVESSPSVVLATLRCLNAVVDAAVLEDIDTQIELEEFLKQLWTDHSMNSLNQILNQDSSKSSIVQKQLALTAELIAKTCNNERRRRQTKISGIFDSLAQQLATFVIAIDDWDYRPVDVRYSGIVPAGPKAELAPLLHAICAVIGDSKMRVSVFCCNAIWRTVFPDHVRDIYASRVPASGSAGVDSESSLNMLSGKPSPSLPREQSSHANPVGWDGSDKTVPDDGQTEPDAEIPEGFNSRDEDDSPLVSWLIKLVRYSDGLTRLMAIWLLGLFFRAQMISAKRRHNLSMLVVPTLIQMLDGKQKGKDMDCSLTGPLASTTIQLAKEIAPRVLALFVQDNDFLQKGAVESGAIKKLSQLLKQSFDPIPSSFITPIWSSHERKHSSLKMETTEKNTLGEQGIPPIVNHIVRLRESLLIGICGMATLKNANRQAIIDHGVVPCVVESLRPRERHERGCDSQDIMKPENSIATLVGACTVVTKLSRSVAALRTSLVDAGLAKPVYTLLRHPDSSVQVAATATVTNLILPFSGMRQDITDAGILDLLCERAHSSDTDLRRSALWALSHFVVEASNDLKIKVIRQLDPKWIQHIICNNNRDSPTPQYHYDGAIFTASNSTGEHVDILSSSEDKSHEYQLHKEAGTLMDFTNDSGQHSQRSPLALNKDLAINADEYFNCATDERAAGIQAARNNLAVQEHGLNLLRNLLIGGPDTSKIVDYLFAELGQDGLFDMFTDLLMPKTVDEFIGSDRRTSITATKLVPPPTEIVIGVCYTLVHIAASHPQHKEIVLGQTELLKLIIPLFTHPHAVVRTALLWFVINVSWKEDANDKEAASARAQVLKKLGVLDRIEEAAADSHLDVRETAKHAYSALTDLMKE